MGQEDVFLGHSLRCELQQRQGVPVVALGTEHEAGCVAVQAVDYPVRCTGVMDDATPVSKFMLDPPLQLQVVAIRVALLEARVVTRGGRSVSFCLIGNADTPPRRLPEHTQMLLLQGHGGVVKAVGTATASNSAFELGAVKRCSVTCEASGCLLSEPSTQTSGLVECLGQPQDRDRLPAPGSAPLRGSVPRRREQWQLANRSSRDRIN
mmetsp:Transcript_77688/g.173872  ORF Transcript_77688/g.173872 Transcript_77688/m.173872 type:complete len:208 (+) Transcript_77688:1-624(+)